MIRILLFTSLIFSCCLYGQKAGDIYGLLDYKISVVNNRLENTLKCNKTNDFVENGVKSYFYYCDEHESFLVYEENNTVNKIMYINGDPQQRLDYFNYLLNEGFVMVELGDIGLNRYAEKTIVGQLVNKSNVVALITGNENPVSSFIFYIGNF